MIANKTVIFSHRREWLKSADRSIYHTFDTANYWLAKVGCPTHTFIMSLGRTLWAHCSAPLPPSIHPSLLHCCNGISIAALAAVFKRRGRLHSRSSLWQLKNEMDCHWPVVIKTGHESQICVMWKKERTQKMKRGNKSSYFPMSNH